ncbi:hypothetical protein FSY75_05820 [Streptomyces sp. TR1341]|uniref:DUF6182 family protein n=1 Tax=Streptomyces sp. TR1341 TaxID=2601266 RepID=UPI00138AF9FB|nr:hypothetical protein [Streptomyces sp. TR1341]
MTLSPDLLLTVAADRLRTLRPELAAHLDLPTPDALREAKDAVMTAGTAGVTQVVSVVGDLRLPDWVRETCRFALSLPADRRTAWQRSFTRTVYLAGRPDNLQERFSFAYAAPDGSVAWTDPAAPEATAALRRLLRTFRGTHTPAVWNAVTVEIPPPGAPEAEQCAPARPPVHRDLYIATARMTISDLLVQVNHLLAEAVLDGILRPGDRMTLRPVPRLTGLDVPLAALRVDTDAHAPHHLRAYAALTQET